MRLFYYLVIKPISLLPWSVVYGISNLLYLVGYKIIRYRVSVVHKNLTNSFPDKSPSEIKQLQNDFYRHFCDIMLESFKIFSISEKEAKERFVALNPEILKPYFDRGQSVILVGGHYNNWEMLAVGLDCYIDHQSVAIYHRMKNEFMNEKALQSRSKYGLKMISRQEVKDFFAQSKDLTVTIFGADQSPSIAKKVYWTNFLNQETAVMFGVEKFALEKNLPVVYGAISKVKRGHYEFTMEVLIEDPSQCAHGEITEAHTRRLEKQILEDPQYWLWSHKRWKRKRKSEDT
ncbi:lysophospholipid acyltransferase family protein [Roseivirga misakiensis]|uniref:Lipid A biosynthesis acyltransferase n=1 Tax=Roseivirga misakiensis TaxID=1563681 RepID=A0A1E5T5F8_9BACT|nr:lysophospholipid acyltransferase family protein [Roseivirga misakiensis]OEK06586.1 hypothetical protein BFP71_02640 [Roseivirga misakiensis]